MPESFTEKVPFARSMTTEAFVLESFGVFQVAFVFLTTQAASPGGMVTTAGLSSPPTYTVTPSATGSTLPSFDAASSAKSPFTEALSAAAVTESVTAPFTFEKAIVGGVDAATSEVQPEGLVTPTARTRYTREESGPGATSSHETVFAGRLAAGANAPGT